MPKGSGSHSNSGRERYPVTGKKMTMELQYSGSSPMGPMVPEDRKAWERKWHILPKDGVDRRGKARDKIMDKADANLSEWETQRKKNRLRKADEPEAEKHIQRRYR